MDRWSPWFQGSKVGAPHCLGQLTGSQGKMKSSMKIPGWHLLRGSRGWTQTPLAPGFGWSWEPPGMLRAVGALVKQPCAGREEMLWPRRARELSLTCPHAGEGRRASLRLEATLGIVSTKLLLKAGPDRMTQGFIPHILVTFGDRARETSRGKKLPALP